MSATSLISLLPLVDTRALPGFATEFGFSLLLNYHGRKILIDTGAGVALLENLNRAGLSPDSLDAVFLTHGHSDHTGGLENLPYTGTLYAAPGITNPCYSRHSQGELHCLRMPLRSRQRLLQVQHYVNSAFEEIFPGIFATGPIPRTSGEDCGGDFYEDLQCQHPNEIFEEQALLLREGILITGCCHAGLCNTIQYCREKHPEIPIRVIVGGLHLRHAAPQRLEQTVKLLQDLPLEQLWLFHCTGENAANCFRRHLSCKVSWGQVGENIVLMQGTLS